MQTYKIYRISSPLLNNCYIGSTKNALCLRKAIHNHHHKLYNEGKFNYVSSFKVLDGKDAEWEIVEDNINKEDLKDRESHWINYYDNCVNKYLKRRYFKNDLKK